MNIKDTTNFIVEEGKKLPKAVWIAALIIPGGFEVLGLYFVARAVIKRKK